MNTHAKAMIVGAAVAGLLGGSAAMAASSNGASGSQPGVAMKTMADKDTHSCKGQNTCKGKGGCKSVDNGCKGQNSCKGKGGCATDGSKK